MVKTTREHRIRRHLHTRKLISGTAERPRLTVFRSNKHIYAQLINDVTHKTLKTVSDVKIDKGTPVERAHEVGKMLAAAAAEMQVAALVFDRSGYKFHGRVKAIAEGAREGGMQF